MKCIPRSLLYAPLNSERILKKLVTLNADTFILDLEDGVGPEQKGVARSNLERWTKAEDGILERVILRINAIDSPYLQEDLRALTDIPKIRYLIPKIKNADELKQGYALIRENVSKDHEVRLWIMVETLEALTEIEDLVRAGRSEGDILQGLVIGKNDLALDAGFMGGRGSLSLNIWLSNIILYAKAQGLLVIDGVWNRFKDLEGFKLECIKGRELGFDGKSLIHPNQIDLCNKIYGPSKEELTFAEKVVAAFELEEAKERGVTSVEGEMVELLHLAQCQRLLGIGDG